MKVKKGDEVVVIAGKDRGVRGKVIEAMPEHHREVRWCLDEQVNYVQPILRAEVDQS